MDKKIVLKWIQDRLSFISQNCDLNEEFNKQAYDVLSYIKKTMEDKQ